MSIKDEEDKAPSYIWHDKFYRQLKAYYPDPAKRCLMHDMLDEYGLYGIEPKSFESLADKIFFDNSKEFIDYDIKKRAANREAKSKAGSHHNHKNQYMNKKDSSEDNKESSDESINEDINSDVDNTPEEDINTSNVSAVISFPVEDTSNMEETCSKVEQVEQNGTSGTERNEWNLYAYAYAYRSLYLYLLNKLKLASKHYSEEVFKTEIPILQKTGLSENDLVQTFKNFFMCLEAPECFETCQFDSITKFFKMNNKYYEKFYPQNFNILNHLSKDFHGNKEDVLKKYSAPPPVAKSDYELLLERLENNPRCLDCNALMKENTEGEKYFECAACLKRFFVDNDNGKGHIRFEKVVRFDSTAIFNINNIAHYQTT